MENTKVPMFPDWETLPDNLQPIYRDARNKVAFLFEGQDASAVGAIIRGAMIALADANCPVEVHMGVVLPSMIRGVRNAASHVAAERGGIFHLLP